MSYAKEYLDLICEAEGDYPIDPALADKLADAEIKRITASLDPAAPTHTKYSDMVLSDVIALLKFYSDVRSWALGTERLPREAAKYWSSAESQFDALDAAGITRVIPRSLYVALSSR